MIACCSPTAAGVRQQSAAWGGGELPISRRDIEKLSCGSSAKSLPKGGAVAARRNIPSCGRVIISSATFGWEEINFYICFIAR